MTGQDRRRPSPEAVPGVSEEGLPFAYSLFQQPWWLDAVAPGRWHEVTIAREGRVVARLPYVVRRRGGLTFLGQPPLTQTLGPWVEPSIAKRQKALAREMTLLTALVDALPPADRFTQALSPRLTNALPFYWQGFTLGVRYTYRLEDLGSQEELWKGLDTAVRTDIRKARQNVVVRDDLGLDVFREVYVKTFSRQGIPMPHAWSLVEHIDEAATARGSRCMLFAQDGLNRVHAVLYVVHDGEAAYSLLAGGDPDLRRSGAGMLLEWEAIGRVAGLTKVYDFEGSMLLGVERVYRRFGARQTPYVVVSRDSRRLRAVSAVRELWATARGRN